MQQNENTAAKIIHIPGKQDSKTKQPVVVDKHARGAQRTLEVLQLLNRSLDLETILDNFVRELTVELPLDGIEYSYEAVNTYIRKGRQSKQSCFYNLVVEQQDLGRITFRRRYKFTEDELKKIEDLLCALVYPLRNSVRYQRALELAYRDTLTGLANRTALDHQLKKEISRTSRHGTPLCLSIIDVDNFKYINDRYGHLAGDQILINISSILVSNIRSGDLVFRYAGDEFIILLNNTKLAGANLAVERIRSAVEKGSYPVVVDEQIKPTISIGITEFRPKDDLKSLFRRADEAMYEAKARGRDKVYTG